VAQQTHGERGARNLILTPTQTPQALESAPKTRSPIQSLKLQAGRRLQLET
jgi:hypothetical protein